MYKHHAVQLLAVLVLLCIVQTLSQPLNELEKRTVRSNTKTFHIVTLYKKNWINALHECHFYGMQLAVIASATENNEAIEAIKQAGLGGSEVWTSGTDKVRTGHYMWATAGTRISYTNWEVKQPDNWAGRQHCLLYRTYKGEYRWDDQECGLEKFFLCEKTY